MRGCKGEGRLSVQRLRGQEASDGYAQRHCMLLSCPGLSCNSRSSRTYSLMATFVCRPVGQSQRNSSKGAPVTILLSSQSPSSPVYGRACTFLFNSAASEHKAVKAASGRSSTAPSAHQAQNSRAHTGISPAHVKTFCRCPLLKQVQQHTRLCKFQEPAACRQPDTRSVLAASN